MLAVGDCRVRGARREAEEVVSSEAPISITRLTENIYKSVIANGCMPRGMGWRKLVEERGDGRIYCRISASL